MISLDVTNEAYHAETDHLSSSTLKAALPEHYKQGGSQDALDFGTLVHAVVLEPNTLSQFAVLDAHAIAGDNPRTGKPYDAPQMTARFKAAAAEAAETGKTVVSAEDWERAHKMADAINDHREARGLFWGDSEGQNEVSAFVTDHGGHKLKARFDRIVPGAIIDLKTTSAKPGAQSLTRTVLDYGYDLSAAHYLDVATLAELDATKFIWCFVTKTEPYRVTVAEAHPDYIARGRDLRDQALARITDWTAEPYEGARGRLVLSPPPWARLSTTPAGIPADFQWSIYDNA